MDQDDEHPDDEGSGAPAPHMSWDEAAALVPREKDGVKLSKNAWKREVRKLMYETKKARRPKKVVAEEAPLGAEPRESKKPKKEARDLTLVLDCSYDELMSDKEITSLAGQIKEVYSKCNRLEKPARFVVYGTHVARLKAALDKHPWQRWSNFEPRDGSFWDPAHNWDKEKVFVLSSEADSVLQDVPEGSVIVIGGIIDKNRHKGVVHRKAIENGFRTFRLPLEENADVRLKVLTCNSCAGIVMDFVESGDWKESVSKNVPKRKLN